MTDWTHINPKSGMDLLQTLSEDASTGDKTSVTHLKGLLKNILKDDDCIKLYGTMIESFRAIKHITFINSTTGTSSSSFRNSYIIESWKNIAESMYTISNNPDKYKSVITDITYFSKSFFHFIYNELDTYFKDDHNNLIRISKFVPFHPILKPLSLLLSNRIYYNKITAKDAISIIELSYKHQFALSEIILQLIEIDKNKPKKTIIIDNIIALSLWREDFDMMNDSNLSNKFSGLIFICIIGQELKEVPDFLKKYNNVVYLNLDNNSIQNLPDDFNIWFPGLEHLIITNNKLTEFPQIIRKFESLKRFDSDFNNSERDFFLGYHTKENTLTNIIGLIRLHINTTPNMPAEQISNTYLGHVINDIYITRFHGNVYDIASVIINLNKDLFKYEMVKYIFGLLKPEDANQQNLINNSNSIQYNEGFRLIDLYLYIPKKIREREDPHSELYNILKSKTTEYKSLSPVSLIESPSGRIYKKPPKSSMSRYEIIISMHGTVSNTDTETIDNKFRNVKWIACRGNVLATNNIQPFNQLICDDHIEKITDARFKTGKPITIEKLGLVVDTNNKLDIDDDKGIFVCDKHEHTSTKIWNPFDISTQLPSGFQRDNMVLFTTLREAITFIYGELKKRGINPNQCDLIVSACRNVAYESTQIIQYARPRHRTRKHVPKPVSKIRTQYTKKRTPKYKMSSSK